MKYKFYDMTVTTVSTGIAGSHLPYEPPKCEALLFKNADPLCDSGRDVFNGNTEIEKDEDTGDNVI